MFLNLESEDILESGDIFSGPHFFKGLCEGHDLDLGLRLKLVIIGFSAIRLVWG